MAISIGLPFYNAEDFLQDAIRSVFAQTYQDWELILIDDGSTDRSLEIAKSVNDPRVKVYSDGKNKRLATRLNEIALLANNEFIARMDADDLMSPIRLEEQIKILLANPGIDLVSTGVFSVTNDLVLIGKRGVAATNITLNDLLQKKIGFTHAAVLGRKEWFLRNPYNTSLKIAQDYDLWLRSSVNNDFNVSVISSPLYYYREEGNATPGKLLAAYKNERKMYKTYGGKLYPYLFLKSVFKSLVVALLSRIGKMELLLNNRNSAVLDQLTLELFSREIAIIRSTNVPGLEDRIHL